MFLGLATVAVMTTISLLVRVNSDNRGCPLEFWPA